jgi:hypothetical protein
MIWVGNASLMGETGNSRTILARKPEGKRQLERRKHRWNNSIKMYVKELRCGLDSSGSGLGQVAGSCEYGNESLGSIKGGEFLD